MKIWEKIRTRGGNNAVLRKTHRIRTEEEEDALIIQWGLKKETTY